MNRRIVTFVSLAVIAVLAVGQVFTAARGFSTLENRYLSLWPEADRESVLSGAWMEELENYLADHVPARDEWVQLKNTAARLSGRQQIGQVVFGEEGRLIQVQDVSLEQLAKNTALISDFAAQLPEDVDFYFLLAPNASWIYREQLPEETQTYDPEAASQVVAEGLSERVELVVPTEVLRAHREEAIYFKSDHHWTMRGAAYAYGQLAEAMGKTAETNSKTDVDSGTAVLSAYEVQVVSHNFKGSLYSQAPTFGYEGEEFEVIQVPGLQAEWHTETDSGTVLMEEKLAEKDLYAAFFGGNYGLTRIANETARSEEKLLILKDSYANILVPFLIEDYSEIVMVDLRYYRGSVRELVQREAVDRIAAIYNLDFLCTDESFVWLGV